MPHSLASIRLIGDDLADRSGAGVIGPSGSA
jgi:hypothetical protein